MREQAGHMTTMNICYKHKIMNYLIIKYGETILVLTENYYDSHTSICNQHTLYCQ